MGDQRSWTKRWFNRRALVAHLLVLILFPGCLVAGWWQATIAMSGNGLAYLYAFEWPVFAIFSAILWWNFIHDAPGTYGASKLRALRVARKEDEHVNVRPIERYRTPDEDEDLSSYNDYLEQLAKKNQPKTWRKQ
jgi:DNA-binding transcriptional regulator of glucitol operon